MTPEQIELFKENLEFYREEGSVGKAYLYKLNNCAIKYRIYVEILDTSKYDNYDKINFKDGSEVIIYLLMSSLILLLYDITGIDIVNTRELDLIDNKDLLEEIQWIEEKNI